LVELLAPKSGAVPSCAMTVVFANAGAAPNEKASKNASDQAMAVGKLRIFMPETYHARVSARTCFGDRSVGAFSPSRAQSEKIWTTYDSESLVRTTAMPTRR
jgi:hypothetical protein